MGKRISTLGAVSTVTKEAKLYVEPIPKSNLLLPHLLMDSGASKHVVDPIDQKALQGDKTVTPALETFRLPNGAAMTGSRSIELPLPVEEPGRTAIVLDDMSGGSILSVAQLADSGLTTTFTPTVVQVKTKEDEILMSAPRDKSGLWYYRPEAEPTEEPDPGKTMRLAAVRSYQQRVNLLSDSERVAFAHAVMGYPTFATFLDSVERMKFPLLTRAMVQKNPPVAVETARGHMQASRQGYQSTQPKPSVLPRKEIEPDSPTEGADAGSDLLCRCHTVYADATGPYTTTYGGNLYVMILHSSALNYTFIRAMKSKAEYSSTILAIEQEITSRGHRVHRIVTDNEMTHEATVTLRDRSISMAVQFAPPYNHRTNDAERHVQTAKAHIISTWEGKDPRTPDWLWGEQMPQVEVTLNLLRAGPGGIASAFEAFWHQPYDWGR